MGKPERIGFVFRNRAPIGGAWECLIDGKPEEWEEKFFRTKAEAEKWGKAHTDFLIVDSERRGGQWRRRKRPAQYWGK